MPASLRKLFGAAGKPKRQLLRGWLRRGRRRAWGAVAAVTVVVLAAGWAAWGTSLLGVRDVRVTGTSILTEAQVREQAAVPARTPLLRVRTAEVADRVSELPPVASVQVRRGWPDTVVIEVAERTPVAAVPTGAGFMLIDAEGVAFQEVSEPGALPVVIVVEPGPEDPDTAAALTVLAALTPALREELDTVTVSGPASIELELSSGWTVVWGDQRDSAAKARVATALLERDGDVIDVSTPEVVSVR